MKIKYFDKLKSFFTQGLSFLKTKKKDFYKNEDATQKTSTIRVVIGIVLCLVTVYVGAIALIYGVILAAVGIAVYFLIPPGFLEEKGINLSNLIEDKEDKKSKK
ncbi:MAG: hypothetical protein ACK5N8_04410 [Alphaproteobacteria bacterium]